MQYYCPTSAASGHRVHYLLTGQGRMGVVFLLDGQGGQWVVRVVEGGRVGAQFLVQIKFSCLKIFALISLNTLFGQKWACLTIRPIT